VPSARRTSDHSGDTPVSQLPDNLARYHRQTLLPGFGEQGQRRLLNSRALIVGCGALGCTVADSLARAGVGHLTLIDRDLVELTNLQRQTLYDERDAAEGAPKAEAAARRLRAVNSGIEITPRISDVNARNAEDLARGQHGGGVVIDCTDNFQTRYLLNDTCVKLNIPLIYGGAVGTAGMTMTILPTQTPCLRCIFPEAPPPGVSPTCDTAGVLGPMIGIVGSVQAAEALKVLLGRTDLIQPALRQWDIWSGGGGGGGQHRTIDLSNIDRSACPCCAQRRFDYLEGAHSDSGTTSLCGSNAIQLLPAGATTIDLADLAARLRPHGQFSTNAHLLRGTLAAERDRSGGVGEGGGRDGGGGAAIELTVFRDGRAIVKGTHDPTYARTIYAKYIGA